jgi:hypothetical protein
LEKRDWSAMNEMAARLLRERTGEDVATWNARILTEGPGDEGGLREWLEARGVTGYARSLLIRERFGYPDFLVSSSDELIDGQYADRPTLRPIYDAIIEVVSALGDVTVQARKTYVSLVGPKRTFARIQPTTRNRVDLGLRLVDQIPCGRLQPSRIHESMHLQISLTHPEQVDSEIAEWLRRAYAQNT